MYRGFVVVIVAGYLSLTGSTETRAADWPQFRGPSSAARAEASGLPATWDAASHIVWKTELPGPGASSPVTFGGRIYVTCYSGYGADAKEPGEMSQLKRHLVCLDRDGKTVWDSVQPATHPQKAYQGFIALHGYASGTPAVDESGIYVFYGATGAAAYGFDGQQRWLTNCGTGTHDFGTANSPVLFQDLVIVNASVECGDLIALNKNTGEVVWRQAGMEMSWNTPALVKTAQGTWELAVSIKGQVLGFDPATGEKLWNCQAIDDYICPSVLAEGDVLFALGGRRATTLAIRSGGRGDVTASHKLWELREGSNVCSPVYFQGHLYWSHDTKGSVYCVDAKTGAVVYEKRLSPNPGKIYASPTAADGKLYFVSREKGTYVLPAQPAFELLAHNVIETDDSIFNGSPAIFEGRILLRSDKFLYCIGQ